MKIVIVIAARFPLSAQTQRLFALCRGVILNADYDLRLEDDVPGDDPPSDGSPQAETQTKH